MNGTSSPPGASPPPLPAGWTEHKTSNGHTYYYNKASGQSSWTRPVNSPGGEGDESNHLERVAPRGWTKEINPITSTPIYTNSSNNERWSLASDGRGNYYYYNMANPTLTVGELPEIAEMPSNQENIYDSLAPVPAHTPSHAPAYATVNGAAETASPHHIPSSILALTSQLDVFALSMSSVLKKHGYLSRKKMFDVQGKKHKDKSWQRVFVDLVNYEILFYHDHKSKESPGSKPNSVFCLLQSTVSPYNKDKKKFVFQVSSHLGEQFLLQADSLQVMNDWYSTIQTAIDKANQDYKEHPEKFNHVETGDNSPRSAFKNKEKRPSKGRVHSMSDEVLLDEEYDPMDDTEISAADRSVRIRGRLRRLMARRPEKDSLKSKGILEDSVFGCDLSEFCERHGTMVPKFFTHFIEHIEAHGLEVVGIYRLSGNAASINKLRYQIDQDEQYDLDNPEWADINIISGCLKLYLRELPDPLIPFRMYRSFIDAARSPSQVQRIQQIAARVKELPSQNYCTLKALIMHLNRVVEKGHINKMLATNVAIVFGPTVMRAEMDSFEMATLMPVQNGIMELILNESDSIFKK